MAYPLISAEGNVLSWGSTNFYSRLLSQVSSHSATINVLGDTPETTPFNVARRTYIPGLRQWNFSITSQLYIGTPTVRLGNVGLVAMSPGFTYLIDSYEVTLETDVFDITAIAGPSSGPTWRDWRPGIVRGYGTLRGRATSDGTIVEPLAPAAAPSIATLTLTYGDEAVDDTLAGAALLTPLNHTMQRGDLQRVEYGFQFTGDITSGGTTRLWNTTGSGTSEVIGAWPWSAGASAAGAIVIESKANDQRYNGTDSFLRSVTLRVAVGDIVEYQIEGQGVGSLTQPT